MKILYEVKGKTNSQSMTINDNYFYNQSKQFPFLIESQVSSIEEFFADWVNEDYEILIYKMTK